MEKFEINILGCGAALPTPHHFCSMQVVNIREKLIMIDCAEGAQIQLRRSKLRFAHINHILLTHLHGDHCFGLLGVLSTFGLLGRTATLHVWGPKGLKQTFQSQIDFFCADSPYTIELHEVNHKQSELIFEDRSLTIKTIPLNHRVPCVGYLLSEKPTPLHIRRDAIDAFGIPYCYINNIKAGQDFVLEDGTVIENKLLTEPADPTRSYAYCSDTMFAPHNAELLQGVTMLYHEATFMNEHSLLAKKVAHSTATQAGEMAKLCNAGKLLIGHLSARYTDEEMVLKEAQQVFAKTILAHEGLKISL